jgi:hypothetical protein
MRLASELKTQIIDWLGKGRKTLKDWSHRDPSFEKLFCHEISKILQCFAPQGFLFFFIVLLSCGLQTFDKKMLDILLAFIS